MSVRIGPDSEESLLLFITSERCMTDTSRNNIVFLPNARLTPTDNVPYKFQYQCTSTLTYGEPTSVFNLKFFVFLIKAAKTATNSVLQEWTESADVCSQEMSQKSSCFIKATDNNFQSGLT